MRQQLHAKLPWFKPNSFSINKRFNFPINQPSLYQSQPQEHQSYSHLLKLCLQQCKIIQSRKMLDALPQRLGLYLNIGKTIHAQSLRLGIASKGDLANAIVDLYAKCWDSDYAEKAFSCLEERDESSWNSIISMYSRKGLLDSVLEAFGFMWNEGVVGNQFSCAVVLSACAKLMEFKFGKLVHCEVLKVGFEADGFCEGALINMYAKCGYVVDARRIFDQGELLDAISWTAMISGYVQVGLPVEAIKVLEEMQRVGHVPDQVLVGTILNLFVGLGRLDDACEWFSKMPCPNPVAWNVMISGHVKSGFEREAIRLFGSMMVAGVPPTRSTLGSVLSAIASVANYEYGLQIHGQSIKQGLDTNVYVGSSLINMYAKCRKMNAAKAIFTGLGEKNDVLWNTLLGGYAQNGYAHEVIRLFLCMKISGFPPDDYTYTSILSACAGLESTEIGRQLHSIIIKNKFGLNVYVGNALVDMYAKCGDLASARKQFELMRNKDHVSWNAIIVGYVQEEQEEEAFLLFSRMMSEGSRPDEVSLASVLNAASSLQDLNKGRQIHCFLVKYGLERGLYAGSSLIDMYCKCGIIGAATDIFYCMPERNVVCANALIAGYAKADLDQAVNILQLVLVEGLKPSEVTFATLLEACTDTSKLCLGRQIHCSVLKLGLDQHDEFLIVSLLGMYMAARRTTDANILFSELPYPRSRIMYTAMISGSIQNDCCEEAVLWYQEMRHHNAMPDQATFASILRACSILASLQDGRKLHTLVFQSGYDKDELTGSALVDMYAKCGDVVSSAKVFGEMISRKDVISWNSMIVGYAKNGYAEKALQIFDEMKQEHIKPDEVTFLGVLTACSHAGLISEGQKLYNDMINSYKIDPRVDHCACMIDLYGRLGLLREAEEFIDNLDFEPDSMIWATYLSACKLHRDDVRGQLAAEKLIELEPHNSSPYVLLSNIYAASGNWEGVNSVRRKMNDKGVMKFPGCSWIVIGTTTNLFVAGDKFHRNASEILGLLGDLTVVMKDEGYVVESESSMLDEDQEYILSPLN